MRLALRENRNRGVVTVQALGGEHVRFDALQKRRQHRAAGADLVGERRQGKRDTLAGIALGLAVQGLMLPELLKQQHGKQVRSGPAAWRDMERRWWFADPLAVPARHLLAHVLDDLSLARDHVQRLCDGLAEFSQVRATAAVARGGAGNDPPLAG